MSAAAAAHSPRALAPSPALVLPRVQPSGVRGCRRTLLPLALSCSSSRRLLGASRRILVKMRPAQSYPVTPSPYAASSGRVAGGLQCSQRPWPWDGSLTNSAVLPTSRRYFEQRLLVEWHMGWLKRFGTNLQRLYGAQLKNYEARACALAGARRADRSRRCPFPTASLLRAQSPPPSPCRRVGSAQPTRPANAMSPPSRVPMRMRWLRSETAAMRPYGQPCARCFRVLTVWAQWTVRTVVGARGQGIGIGG